MGGRDFFNLEMMAPEEQLVFLFKKSDIVLV